MPIVVTPGSVTVLVAVLVAVLTVVSVVVPVVVVPGRVLVVPGAVVVLNTVVVLVTVVGVVAVVELVELVDDVDDVDEVSVEPVVSDDEELLVVSEGSRPAMRPADDACVVDANAIRAASPAPSRTTPPDMSTLRIIFRFIGITARVRRRALSL